LAEEAGVTSEAGAGVLNMVLSDDQLTNELLDKFQAQMK
jgi:hypothetical protein